MTRPLISGLFAGVFLVAVAGCDGSDPDDGEGDLTIVGEWTGAFSAQEANWTLDLMLNEASFSVRGRGQLKAGSQNLSFTVAGSYLHPSISLELEYPNQPPSSLNGNVRDDRDQIVAQISGSGFGGEAVILRRP